MEKKWIVFMVFVCVGFLSACKNENAYIASDLNGKWTIISVKNEPVKMETMPFLEFNITEKKIHGNTGCNVLNAGFQSDEKDMTAFKITAPFSTMMACDNLETEFKILQAINEITNVRTGEKSNQVALADKDGETMLVLQKTE